MRLAWATDIHLNFLERRELDAFFATLADANPDAVIVSGDIAEADSVEPYLVAMERALARPIYFVLGNHDYYGGAIAEVRARMAALGERVPHLRWLNAAGVVPLSDETALVGHDGWSDGRFGDYARSTVLLNDYFHIRELTGLDAATRLKALNRLGDEAAAHFRAILKPALARYRRVIVVTHVPPFREACWHEGRISDDNWLPHFASRAAGEALVEAAGARPDREVLVLCGHSHGEVVARPLANLEVRTGGAEYGAPALQSLIEVH